MKIVSTIGPNVSPRSFTHSTPPAAIHFAAHVFEATREGTLQHSINGQLRAIVPPAGFDEYVEAWPDCRPVIDELRAAEASAGVSLVSQRPPLPLLPPPHAASLSLVPRGPGPDLSGGDAPGI